MGLFDRFRHFETQFGLIGQVLKLFDEFGQFLKFRISAEELSQLLCRIHRKFKVVIGQVLQLFDEFGAFQKFRISAEELSSQVLCRIHRKFKIIKFAN